MIKIGLCLLAVLLLFCGCGLRNEEDRKQVPKDTSFTCTEVMEGVWDIVDGMPQFATQVDIYVVEGEDRALVIDAGVSGSDLLTYVRALTDKPLDLLLTHGHGDHIAAAEQFDSVYMSSKDFDLIWPYVPYEDFASSGIKDLKGGEIFDLGGVRLEVLAMPGHTPGSVIVLDRERQLLFGGDAIGSGSLWLQLPESGPVEAYLDEIRTVEELAADLPDIRLLLGHSCMMGRYADASYITDTRIAAEKILAGEIGGPSEKEDYPGTYTASYGQMTEFRYRPEKVREGD